MHAIKKLQKELYATWGRTGWIEAQTSLYSYCQEIWALTLGDKPCEMELSWVGLAVGVESWLLQPGTDGATSTVRSDSEEAGRRHRQ